VVPLGSQLLLKPVELDEHDQNKSEFGCQLNYGTPPPGFVWEIYGDMSKNKQPNGPSWHAFLSSTAAERERENHRILQTATARAARAARAAKTAKTCENS
jgi:hypothetical protein